jgi:Nucleotidyltransferase domain
VRSLNSSVFKWPDAQTVDKAVREWAKKIINSHPDVMRIGYFGSYASNNWGVGSDLDLIIILKESLQSFDKRAAAWDATELPVPTDLLIYTQQEWNSFDRNSKFYQMLLHGTKWIYALDDQT